MWFSSACGACFRMRWPGRFFRYLLYLAQQTTQGLLPFGYAGTFGVVVPRHANEGGQTAGSGLCVGGLLCGSRRRAAGKVHLRTCGRAKAVGSVGTHDYVGIVGGPDEELYEEPAWPAVVASRLVQVCDLVVLVHGSHVPETRGKVRVPTKLCEKNLVANLPGVVNYELWHGQLSEPVPHMPVHSGRSPWVVVVAQEVDGFAVLPVCSSACGRVRQSCRNDP